MRGTLTALCVLVMGFGSRPVRGQLPARERETPSVLTTWHQTQKVHALAQTPDGFLWAGTDSGLLRYDGTDFVTFTSRDGLPGNLVRALAVDPDGSLWAGLAEGRGLANLRGFRVRAVATSDALANLDVQELLVEPGVAGEPGTLWIGTSGGLLHARRDASQSPLRIDIVSSLPSEPILSLARAPDPETGGRQAIWVGGPSGLWRGLDGAFRKVYGDGPVLAIAAEPSGALLFSAAGAGLYRLDGQSAAPRLVVRSAGDAQATGVAGDAIGLGFTALAQDGHGRVWAGWNAGYALWSGEQLAPRYTTGLHTVDLLGDTVGGVWIATYWGVVSRVGRPRAHNAVFSAPGQPAIVFSVTQEPGGILWLSTVFSVVRIAPDGSVRRFESGQDLPGSWCPRSLAAARTGGVWLATCDGGVFRIDGDRAARVPIEGAAVRNFQAIFEDRAGRVWAGAESGRMFRGDLGGLTEVPFPNPTCAPVEGGAPPVLAATQVVLDECAHSPVAFADARDGALWVAIRRGGLRRFAAGTWRSWSKAEGLPTDALISLHEDGDGVLWIGTQASGLVRYDGHRFASVQKADGLPAQSIHGIVEDARGYFWMSSERGVFRVARAELEAFFGGRAARVTGYAYDPRDGLGSFITVQSFPQTLALLPDDRLVVPMDVGLGVVDTRAVFDTTGFAGALIEDVRVAGRSYLDAPPDRVDLGLQADRLSALEYHFRVPNFDVPHRIDIRYRLVGHGDAWTSADRGRVARYENLPAGRYRFELRPYLDDVPFDRVVAGPPLYVRSFYRQPAFFVALAALAALVAVVAYLLRLRYQQARMGTVLAERNRIARDLHDSLAQYFTGIAYQLERLGMLLRRDPGAAEEINEETKVMLAQCRLEARQAIHNLRAEGVERAPLSQALERLASETRMSGTARVEVAIQAPRIEPALPVRLQRELLRIAQEATVNALAHGHASAIRLRVELTSAAVVLEIADDGRGFDPDSAQANRPLHYGLQGMRERAAALGAEFEIESAPGQGTRVRVRARLA